MPINAVCPECQNRFRLHDGMLGKSMRCTVCHEVFIVKEGPAPPKSAGGEKPPAAEPPGPPRTRTDAPPVVSRSGNVSDFVPVIQDVTPLAPPRPTPPPVQTPKPRPPAWPDKIKPPTAAEFPWEEGPKVKPKSPKEVTWSPDLDLPRPIEEPAPERFEPEVEETYAPVATEPIRPPKKKLHKLLLIALIAFVVVGLGTGTFFAVRYYSFAPERMFEAGRKNYEEGNFPQAQSQFEKLVAEYPNNRLVTEARFLAELSRLRHLVSSVMSREEPKAAIDEWNKFVTRIQQDEEFGQFAAKGRKDVDVWQAGTKLLEDVFAKAEKSFNQDSPDESETWLNQAAAIDQGLDRFRPEDVPKPEKLLADMSTLRGKIAAARVRLTDLAKAKEILGTEGDEERRDAAERFAKSRGLDRDPAFIAILAQAERKVQEKAVYTKEPQQIPPVAVPDDGLTSLLFAPRFDRNERRALPGLNTVFYCLARGVLYALDEPDGRVLWAARTGLDTDIMPIRVRASDQNPELVLVASNTGNRFGITARAGRDGRPLWHHSLAVPCHGPPIVVGSNAYVPLGDKIGTVLEIVVATGDITGRITIGRPLGPVMAARAGTGHLYIPADSRAVYVFDVDRRGPEPEFKKLEPVLLGVLTTGHPPGNLRGVPVFSNPDPNEPGPKFFVMGQAAGFDRMKLRTFRLPDETDAKPDASNAYEIALPGWASFPPYCDGEKLAIVTDRGEFGLYGLALDQNNDDMLFAFQTPAPKASDQLPSRGQVVLAEEGAFWIIAAGQLRHFRFGINMGQGVRAIPHGDPVPVGEPLHAPQVNVRGDTFVVVTQDGMTCRATAVDAVTGEVRWRRELGVISKGDPLKIGDAVVIVDQGGGFYRVETKPLLGKSGAAWLLDEKWLISQPARGFTAYTGLIPGPDATALALMVGEGEQAGKLLIRKYSEADKKVLDWSVPAPAPPAGQPVVFGKFFVIPLANGNLYRIPLDGANALQQGPTWRGDRLPASVSCYLTPLNDEELYASDGARYVARLYWSSTTQGFELRGRLQLTERPGAMSVLLPGVPPRLVVADSRGNLTVWDGDKLAPPVMGSWRPGEKNNFPAARIDDGLRLMTDANGSQQIVYSAGGRLVVLPPDKDKPKWVSPKPVKAIEGRPVFDNGRVILTDRSGLVRVLDAKTGQETGDEFQLVGSHAFAAAAVPVGGNRFLVPLADGTLVLGELKPRAKEEPKDNGPIPQEQKEPKSEASPKNDPVEKK